MVQGAFQMSETNKSTVSTGPRGALAMKTVVIVLQGFSSSKGKAQRTRVDAGMHDTWHARHVAGRRMGATAAEWCNSS